MKNIRHLAELNYKKAAALFMQLDNPIDILKVQLDQAVLIEDHMQGGQQQDKALTKRKLYKENNHSITKS